MGWVQTFEVTFDISFELLNFLDKCLSFLITKLLPHFFRNATSTKEETIGSEHLA
jgi:hypothetical protein